MESIIHDAQGFIHTLFAIVALITGLYILFTVKGTRIHKKVGYVYALSMLGLNVTAFMIYRLFDGFAVFHWLALVSLITVTAGMIPVMLRKPKGYVTLHLNFMYWSVAGLYSAFVAEIFTRVPFILNMPDSQGLFGILTGVSTALVMIVFTFFYMKYKSRWEAIS